MDEPLSNLDAKLRVQMRAEIARLQSGLGTTTIYVTHDQVEAMTMGERVAVMRKGALQQVAPPQELYDHPVNLFVGGFIGSPAMNLLQARLVRRDGDLLVHFGDQQLVVDPGLVARRPALAAYDGREVILGIRPEDLEDVEHATHALDGRRVRGRVVLREALGSELMIHLDVEVPPAVTDEVRELAEDSGGEAPSEDRPHATVIGRFSARSQVPQGANAEVAVDTANLHFFDPGTGLGIYADEAKGVTT
jgi:multiple sugar transport system ATP-binding protein